MRCIVLILLIFFSCNKSKAQEPVYFFTSDSIKVRGDLYLKNIRFPFIILCHQENSNRSEFYEIAPKLINLNYNCLAVDLRNDVYQHASADIKAAIKYIISINNLPVVLLGSSYSASSCLLFANADPMVKAVIALNPGEYFLPVINMAEHIQKIEKPVFAVATQSEYPYIKKMMAPDISENITLFKPDKVKGIRGTAAFSNTNPDNGQYWFALMMFFKGIESR